MQLYMWIIAVLIMMLIATSLKCLSLKGDVDRAGIKAVMDQKRQLYLEHGIAQLRSQVRRLEAENMFTRSML